MPTMSLTHIHPNKHFIWDTYIYNDKMNYKIVGTKPYRSLEALW